MHTAKTEEMEIEEGEMHEYEKTENKAHQHEGSHKDLDDRMPRHANRHKRAETANNTESTHQDHQSNRMVLLRALRILHHHAITLLLHHCTEHILPQLALNLLEAHDVSLQQSDLLAKHACTLRVRRYFTGSLVVCEVAWRQQVVGGDAQLVRVGTDMSKGLEHVVLVLVVGVARLAWRLGLANG